MTDPGGPLNRSPHPDVSSAPGYGRGMPATRLTDLRTRAQIRAECAAGRRVLATCSVCGTEHEHRVIEAKTSGAGAEVLIVPLAQGDSPRFFCGPERRVRVELNG